MSILSKLFRIDSNVLTVEEATDFSLANMAFIEENEVAYGLNYQDNGNGSSEVKLLISPLYQPKTYECCIGVNVTSEFKDQLSLTLIENSAEIDKIGIIFPEEETSKEGEKHIKSLTFNTYEIKHSTNAPAVKHSGKTKLQKNANDSNLANKDTSYFQPKAVKVDNGDVIVIAHNLKDEILVFWYLKRGENGKFKALGGKNKVIERRLFKFDNPGQLVLNGNTMLYAQMSKKITKENQEMRKTQIFKFSVAEVVQKLKDGKGVEEFLFGHKNGQINKASFLSSEQEISFLQYVQQIKGKGLVAFLATDRSSNEQELHLTSLVKNGLKSNFTVCGCEDPVEQLYVKDNGQDGFIVTAISGENIITFNHKNPEKPRKVMIIPANSVKALSDFVNIINGRITPGIVSSSTLASITTTENAETSTKMSTVAIADTTKTGKITELTTEASSPATISTPATSKPIITQTSTAPTAVKPITIAETTVTPQATMVSTDVPTVSLDITTKPTTATISSTSIMSSTTMIKSSTEPTTVAETTATPQATMVNVPTTNPEKTTQFTIPSTKAKTSVFTTIPQFTSSPHPIRRAITGPDTGIIAGSLLGMTGIVGIIGLIVYKCIKKYRGYYDTAPALELADLESHSNSSNEEIFFVHSRKNNSDILMQSETALNSVSVESSSRSSSPSPKSSKSRNGSGLSWDSDDVPEYHL